MIRQPHSSAYQVTVPFGRHTGVTLGELAERHRSYLEAMTASERVPMYWREAAARALLGEPVPTHLQSNLALIRDNVKFWTLPSGRVACRFPYGPKVTEDFRSSVDGATWNIDEGYWSFPPAQLPRATDVLKQHRLITNDKKADADEQVRRWWLDEKNRTRELNEIRQKETSDLRIPTLLPLRPFQRVGVEFCVRAGGRALEADDMGLGKTPIGIGVALVDGGKTLVVCPAKLSSQWVSEIKKFAGKKASVWTTAGLNGRSSARFHVCPDSIVHRLVRPLLQQEYQVLLVDEAHRYHNYKALRSKALFGYWKEERDWPGLKIPKVVLLTGTPMKNRPRDLFTLLSYLDKDRFVNPNNFRARYEGFGTTGQNQNLTELFERAKELMIRRMKVDVAKEIPPKSRHQLVVEMTAAERKKYMRSLAALFKRWKYEGNPSAAHMHAIRDLMFEFKFPLIVEFITECLESERKLLVFTLRQEHAERIAAAFPGGRARFIHGGVSMVKRDRIKEEAATGKVDLLSITLGTGGEGLDGLQKQFSYSLFPDRDWVPGNHEQAEDRLTRMGQAEPVTNYYITLLRTFDEDMAEVLTEKQGIIDEAINGKRPEDITVDTARNNSIFSEVLARMRLERTTDDGEVVED